MTEREYYKEMTRLTGAVTRARTKLRKLTSLSEKIVQKAAILTAEERLRQHKLNRFGLVQPARIVVGEPE